jgi:GntR family transcriptional regulator/MocR family aminotransferase
VRRGAEHVSRRCDPLVDVLTRTVPAVRISGIAAGLHAVVELAGSQRENEVVALAAEHDLALDGT